jgi:hypothetical protein
MTMQVNEKLFAASSLATIIGWQENLEWGLRIAALVVAIVTGLVVLATRCIQLYRNWRDRDRTVFPVEPPPPR